MAIGHHIKQLREDSGLSQENLALMVNVERAYLAKIEAGKRNPTVDCLEKIVNGLGLNLPEFFSRL
ncbi:helix-turn-helix domain-containing protein [Gordonibacter sp.]|uniref:helix-turn-helix domain-containing protein n=1 Tax=Gordonibacter sp. TaxID=1968902 RepID=UPI002FC8B7E3